jgi:hypothetical protein
MSAAGAVTRGRRAAEALMVDTCTVHAPGDGSTIDEETGAVVPTLGDLLYSGRCRVRMPAAAEDEVTSGGSERTVSDFMVSLPLLESAGIPIGAVVTLTALGPNSDPDLAGSVLTYVAPMSKQTHPTARRMRCREVK